MALSAFYESQPQGEHLVGTILQHTIVKRDDGQGISFSPAKTLKLLKPLPHAPLHSPFANCGELRRSGQ